MPGVNSFPFKTTLTNNGSSTGNRWSIFSTPEFSAAAREVNRSWQTWLLVLSPVVLGAILAALSISIQQNQAASYRAEALAQSNATTLDQLLEAREVIRVQNQRSINDRAHLNAELANTRASLERLERAVKTGQYP